MGFTARARALLPAALLLAGCVTQEHRAVIESREAYARCVEAHSASYGECEALHERQLAEQRRYEENARRAWGCDPAREECPTPR